MFIEYCLWAFVIFWIVVAVFAYKGHVKAVYWGIHNSLLKAFGWIVVLILGESK